MQTFIYDRLTKFTKCQNLLTRGLYYVASDFVHSYQFGNDTHINSIITLLE